MACDACAWRSLWIDAVELTPARSAACLTMELTGRSVGGLPGRPSYDLISARSRPYPSLRGSPRIEQKDATLQI